MEMFVQIVVLREANVVAVNAGIRQRHVAGLRAPMATSRRPFLLATSTPDHLLPPSAPLVAHRLGLGRVGAVDLAGACAGFIYALMFADGFTRPHGKPALVIAANIMSRRINPDVRASSVLFADAASALVIGPCEDNDRGILGASVDSDGSRYRLIQTPAGGSNIPFHGGMGLGQTRELGFKTYPHKAWEFFHVCIDDPSRVAFSQIVPDERKKSAIAFLKAAVAFYASLGVSIARVMTDL